MQVSTGSNEVVSATHLDFRIRAKTEESIAQKKMPERPLLQCLFRGSNSSARTHIRTHHFSEYKKRCEDADPPIQMNEQCIPEEWEKGERQQQTTLKFGAVKQNWETTVEGRIVAVAQFIACENQVCNFSACEGPLLNLFTRVGLDNSR
jgi:hypothetical protein